jgi:site-specific recombinase XerD
MAPQQQTLNGKSIRNASRPDDVQLLDSIHYFIDGFLLKHRSQRHSPRTIDFYRENLQRFVWFLERQLYPTALPDITANHIRHFFIYLNESNEHRWGSDRWGANKPLSPSTIHGYARALRAFFRWATKEARLQFNPFANVDMPHVPSQWKVQTYTDEEIVQLFAACDTFATPFAVHRNRAIVAVLLDSGIRASELLGLEVGDIEPREAIFTVRGKGDKSRPVVVGNFARKELWAYLTHHRLRMDTPSPALFISHTGSALTYNGLMQVFRNLRIRSRIDRVAVRPHILRHTYATKAHRNGMKGATLQEALGHTMFDTTRRYYLDISKEDLAAEHAKYGPLDNMSKQLKVYENSAVQPARQPVENGRFAAKLPDATVLAYEVSQSNYTAVARKYGCSDTAIRKRLRKAGLVP